MRKRIVTDEELDAISSEPSTGEVWWCRGESLRFADGGKVRPVLVVDITSSGAVVIPLTTRKPKAGAVSVSHAAGHSWLTEVRIDVPRLDLVSPLGVWSGYEAWRIKQR